MKTRPNLTNINSGEVWLLYSGSNSCKITGKIGLQLCKLAFLWVSNQVVYKFSGSIKFGKGLFSSIVYHRVYILFQKNKQICFIVANDLFSDAILSFRRYLKTWTFKLVIPNKFVHSINTAGTLNLTNKNLDFIFYDP